MTLQEQLLSVQKAIATIEASGQELEIEVNQNRRNIVRAKLSDLYERESRLKMVIRREEGGGVIHAIPR